MGSYAGEKIERSIRYRLKESMEKMREKMIRFMQGRHGQDEFGRFLLGAAMVCVLLNLLFHSELLYLVAWVLLIYTYFRVFSKNHTARYNENQKYLRTKAKYFYWFGQQKKLANERKIHHIYSCPKCHQKIRIPKGKGKIMVRCPKCHHEFPKRS